MTQPEHTPESDRGLYEKYRVTKDGDRVKDCFVLEPEDDDAALTALKEYARETDDHFLASDLAEWIAKIERKGGAGDGK